MPTKPGRPTKQPAAKKKPAAKKPATNQKPQAFPEWVETAWRLHLRTPNWSEIARQLSRRDPETGAPKYGKVINRESVAHWVPLFTEVVRAALDTSADDALVEYLSELQEVKQAAWAMHQTGDNSNAKTGALRVVLETLEKIAAARGVVTQRKAEQITGKDGGPVQVEQTGGMDEQLARAGRILALVAQCAGGQPGPAGADAEPGGGPVDSPRPD
jgi:hypothetical protein